MACLLDRVIASDVTITSKSCFHGANFCLDKMLLSIHCKVGVNLTVSDERPYTCRLVLTRRS
jgi:hypothetical protein